MSKSDYYDLVTKICFSNTKTRLVEEFSPIKPGKVGMYHCGPTVYAPAHLGNLTPYVYWDVMRRMFEVFDYQVTQVMNFTDIGHIVSDADVGDDKMVSALVKEGKELTLENLHAHGVTIAKTYMQNLDDLGIKIPHHLPYASQHIDEDLKIIQKLLDSNNAYIADDAIYFDTESIPDYDAFDIHGDLDESHARIKSNNDKKNPRDFSLWKFSEADSKIGWDSPWGLGFPGWHIECSAMAWRYLGESFDIHTGGIEHVAVHHTNEIAQSHTAFGKPMAKYWLHNNHLQLNGGKIAKSTGNVMYLDELESEGLHPMDFRYLVLTSHYQSEQNISLKSLHAARKARQSLAKLLDNKDNDQVDAVNYEVLEKLVKNLDTPGSIAVLRTLAKNAELENNNGLRSKLRSTAINLFGLNFDDLEQIAESVSLTPAIKKILNERKKARLAGNYNQSDELRAEIESLGYRVVDQGNRQVITEK